MTVEIDAENGLFIGLKKLSVFQNVVLNGGIITERMDWKRSKRMS
jgi:hypothetical protein